MEALHLKPKKGLRVLKPGTKTPLAAEGEIVDDSSFWKRRLAAGEVEIVKEEEPKKEVPKTKLGGEK